MRGPDRPPNLRLLGADDGIRTRDPHLGKVVLYQLSHVRVCTECRPCPRRASTRLGLATSGGLVQLPVDPNPPSPRADGGSSSTHSGATAGTATISSWAMRSPRRIVTGCS